MQEPVLEDDLKRAPPEGWGFIYMITSPSGRAYVGQTRQSIHLRLDQHKTIGSCPAVYHAFCRYGDKMAIAAIVSARLEFLNDLEQEFIRDLGTMVPRGYNLTSGGGVGSHLSPETRRRISDGSTGHKLSKETKARMSAAKRLWWSTQSPADRQRHPSFQPEAVGRMRAAKLLWWSQRKRPAGVDKTC